MSKKKIIGIAAVVLGIILLFVGIRVLNETKPMNRVKLLNMLEESEIQSEEALLLLLKNATEKFQASMSAEDMFSLAKEENFVVFHSFDILSGEQLWNAFYKSVCAGTLAAVNLADYYTFDRIGVSEEYYEAHKDEYPKIFFTTLLYDGESFWVSSRPGTDRCPPPRRFRPCRCLQP